MSLLMLLSLSAHADTPTATDFVAIPMMTTPVVEIYIDEVTASRYRLDASAILDQGAAWGEQTSMVVDVQCTILLARATLDCGDLGEASLDMVDRAGRSVRFEADLSEMVPAMEGQLVWAFLEDTDGVAIGVKAGDPCFGGDARPSRGQATYCNAVTEPEPGQLCCTYVADLACPGAGETWQVVETYGLIDGNACVFTPTAAEAPSQVLAW